MIPIKGEIELIKYSAHFDGTEWIPGEVIEHVKKTNDISYEYIDRLRRNATLFSNSSRVYISEVRARGPAQAFTGITGTQISNGVWVDRDPLDLSLAAVTLGNRTWRTRFDPPGSGQRDISTIGLKSSSSVDASAALVSLDEICVQTDTQIIDIFYRIYVDDEVTIAAGTTLSARALYQQGKNMFSASTTPTSSPYFQERIVLDWFPAGTESMGTLPSIDGNYTNGTSANADRLMDGMRYAAVTMTSTANVGKLIGSSANANHAYITSSAEFGFYRAESIPFIPVDASPVQSVFPKLKSSTLPFLDIDNQATGTGTVAFVETTAGSWAPEDHAFAELYRILITTSGDVGISDYKFAKQMVLPLQGSAWSTDAETGACGTQIFDSQNDIGRSYVIPPSGDDDGIRHGVSGPVGGGDLSNTTGLLNEGAPVYQQYNWPEFISFGPSYGGYETAYDDIDGITIYDIQGRVLNLNSMTTPALTITDVRQVATEDDGTIWVACADTGLWKILRTAATDLSNGYGTITSVTLQVPTSGTAAGQVLNSTICRGVVARKTNGVAAAGAELWALFDKEMCVSTDSGSTWSVYNNDTTAAVKDGQFIITGVNDTADDASGIMHFEMDHHWVSGTAATDRRFFIATRAVAATSDGQGYWWSTDLADNALGVATFVDIDPMTTLDPTPCTNKLVGTQCIYAGQDAAWYFAIGQNKYGIIRVAYNATVDSGEVSDNDNSTRVGIGINVYFDDAGDDWIVGYDHDNSSSERVRGRRPQNVTSLSTVGSKVLCWRINNSTGTTNYDDLLSGLSAYIGNGVWLSFNVSFGSSKPWVFYRFYEDATGGMDSAGAITDTNIWVDYGWDGTNWVAGNVNSKPTHLASEVLEGGVSIAFTSDGGAPTSFLDTDMYDAYAFRGVLKDNATTLSYSYYPATLPIIRGTEFTDETGVLTTTVPAAPIGVVADEMLTGGWLRSDNQYANFEPGYIGYTEFSGSSNDYELQCEHVFSGDFVVEFGLNKSYGSNNGTRHGFLSTIGTASSNFVGGFLAIDGVPETASQVVRLGAGSTASNNLATVTITMQKTNPLGNDYYLKDNTFRVTRVGGTFTYEYKIPGGVYQPIGAVAGGSGDVVFGTWQELNVNTVVYNGRITSYTNNDYYVYIGDGATTGPGDNTAFLEPDGYTVNTSTFSDPNYRSMALSAVADMKIEVDETGGGGWVNRTININPFTAPAATEVTITRSGKVIFNAADAGRNIRGNWVYTQRLNIK